MPRVSKLPRSSRAQQPTRKAANALGYAKRKSLKSKAIANTSDVYEYQQEKTRRAKVQLVLEKDELAGAPGEASDDEEDGGQSKELRPRLVGENDDDEGIAEDEDEDIDSDAAFDESDEDRFAGFDFSYKKQKISHQQNKNSQASSSKGVHFAEVDLNEDSDTQELDSDIRSGDADEDNEGVGQEEEEEEQGEPDEFIDVLDILDGRGEPDSGDDLGRMEREAVNGVQKASTSRGDGEDDEVMGEEGDDEDEDEDEEDAEGASDEELTTMEPDEDLDIDDSALQTLEAFVAGLDAGTKRKAPDDSDATDARSSDSRKRQRRILKEQTQTGAENEYAAQAGATKLNLDDLLAPLASSSANLQSLKKSAKVLTSTSSKAKTLAAPLPQRTQERLDREAAYEQTKEEIDKWSATMKRIKEAEHLSFPLQAEPVGRPSNLELTAKFKPTTEMESAVDRLLKSAKMREQDIAQTESLKMNHLSVEEVTARREELAKMRELMFRNEAKAKRIAKIKSKTYRRLKKKQKDKLAKKLAELEGEDEDEEETRMKMEVDRARERATLKHKNTGKWAKMLKARSELDQDQRKEINEMLDRGEKLRRRIQGQNSDDESEESEDDESEDGGEGAAERIKASAFNELSQVHGRDEGAPAESGKGKSVFEMKFMKDAALREKQRVDRMADDFVKEMGGMVQERDSDEEAEGAEQVQDIAVARVGGRVSYRPGNMPALRVVPSLASDTSSITLKSTDFPPHDHPPSPALTPPILEARSPEPSNPWLSHEGAKATQKKHEVVVSKDSAGAEKSKNKLRKRVKKREEEKEKAYADAALDISMANVLTLGSSNLDAQSSKPAAKGKQKQTAKSGTRSMSGVDHNGESDTNSELDEQEKILERKGKGAKGVKAFDQRELVALAFAGDNVDFAEAKRREIQEDAPREVDTTLAGWGSWGGLGTKKAPPKPYLIKKIAGVDPTSRADYHKANIIISEKRDKKAAKYLVKDLPYPYTSKAQFERSMDTPIGSEWNTRVGFQRGTLPKVVKKMGTVITPLEKVA